MYWQRPSEGRHGGFRSRLHYQFVQPKALDFDACPSCQVPAGNGRTFGLRALVKTVEMAAMDEASQIHFQQFWKQFRDLDERIGNMEQSLAELAKRLEAMEQAQPAQE